MKYNYFGKYRAIVTKVESKKYNTRIQVMCPSVLGQSPSAWCNPCIPFIDEDCKFVYQVDMNGSSDKHTHSTEKAFPLRVPEVGDPVWVEFEGGDLSKPIWVGTWR